MKGSAKSVFFDLFSKSTESHAVIAIIARMLPSWFTKNACEAL